MTRKHGDLTFKLTFFGCKMSSLYHIIWILELCPPMWCHGDLLQAHTWSHQNTFAVEEFQPLFLHLPCPAAGIFAALPEQNGPVCLWAERQCFLPGFCSSAGRCHSSLCWSWFSGRPPPRDASPPHTAGLRTDTNTVISPPTWQYPVYNAYHGAMFKSSMTPMLRNWCIITRFDLLQSETVQRGTKVRPGTFTQRTRVRFQFISWFEPVKFLFPNFTKCHQSPPKPHHATSAPEQSKVDCVYQDAKGVSGPVHTTAFSGENSELQFHLGYPFAREGTRCGVNGKRSVISDFGHAHYSDMSLRDLCRPNLCLIRTG